MKPDSDISLHPIPSCTGTCNCNLPRFLVRLLDPVIPQEYCIKYCFNFCADRSGKC